MMFVKCLHLAKYCCVIYSRAEKQGKGFLLVFLRTYFDHCSCHTGGACVCMRVCVCVSFEEVASSNNKLLN